MYEIDMLKKQGIPRKSTPLLAIFVTGALAIPLIIASLFIFQYFGNKVQIRFNASMLTKIQQKVSSLPFDKRLDNRLNQELGFGIAYPNELINGIDKALQWTPILDCITSTLPENLAISEFDVKKQVESHRIPDPAKPGQKKQVETITRTLKLRVYNLREDDGNQSAEMYIQSLNNSELLKDKMLSAKIASIKMEEFGEYILPCYTVECVFLTGKKELELADEN